MKIETLFSKYSLPTQIRAALEDAQISSLFPPQAEAVKNGALEGKNLLLSVPTAAGKTLIAELCLVKSILETGGRGLYIVPLKALASEKFDDFKKKYAPLGIRIGMATGDAGEKDTNLNRCQILIATAEKIDSLLRSRTKWLINGLSVVVLDEIHFVNDGSRGPTLEILTARIRQLNPQAQILALSATVSNAEALARWLNATAVVSSWRPIPLKEGVYFQNRIHFLSGPARDVAGDPHDDLSRLVLDTLNGKGQVLVFVNSRRSAQAASRQVCRATASALSADEKKQLVALARKIVGQETSATQICRKLSQAVQHGSAFHHAGLKTNQRKLIEDAFKKNLIKVICATPTLAAGVNLPARRVVIRDIKRFESGLGSAFIPISEYKQCAGRAGRPQYDKCGEAVIMARSNSESKLLFDRYIKADPEPVTSRLNNESALCFHILASVAGGYVHDIRDTFDFLSHTFLAKQDNPPDLIDIIGRIFDLLTREGFVEKNGFRFLATAFGQATSRLYIDPGSAIIIRAGLQKVKNNIPASAFLHLLCCCPDSPILHATRSLQDEVDGFTAQVEDELIVTPADAPRLRDYLLQSGVMKTTFLLARWIEEDREDVLCDTFSVGPGDIYRVTDSARWLSHAAVVFADLFGLKKPAFAFSDLKNRIQYGVKQELLPLCRLKGVGRVRARNLFKFGAKKPAELKYSDLEKLAAVPQIGRQLAKELLKQATTSAGTVDLEAVREFGQRFQPS